MLRWSRASTKAAVTTSWLGAALRFLKNLTNLATISDLADTQSGASIGRKSWYL